MREDLPFIEKIYHLLECLGFNAVSLTQDGKQYIYEHPERNRGFTKQNRIFVSTSKITNFDYAKKVLDDLLDTDGFRFSKQEVAGCCEGLEILKITRRR